MKQAAASDTTATVRRRNRKSIVTLAMALAVIPRTFQSSLFPRSVVDQGLVTGVTVAMVYGLGQLLQDAAGMVGDAFTDSDDSDTESAEMSTAGVLLLSAAAFGGSRVMQQYFAYEPDEKLYRSGARTLSYWVQSVATATAIVAGIELTNRVLSKDEAAAKKRNILPWAVGAGLLYSVGAEYLRVKRHNPEASLKQSLPEARPARAILIGGGITAVLAGVVTAERFVAGRVDGLLTHYTPRLKRNWLPVGHLVATSGLLYGVTKFMQKIMRDIENNAGVLEAGFYERPTETWVSGGVGSLVSWETLSQQSRRHVSTRLSKQAITEVMGSAYAEPIRVYVGLDSAETEEQRVQLALDELERTNAYRRRLLVIISPTGTGYVNYVMSEAVEYLSYGDCASVTLQYSKRPSPLSLDRVDEGHVQYRMLLNGIKRRLAGMHPEDRPRLVLFGESLGAWTSQDAFMHSGTDGLESLGIDRALWIGTPQGSKWKDQVMSQKWLNSEPGLVGICNSFEDVEQLSEPARRKLRYVMVTHHDDPVAQFGAELLIRQPKWINNPSLRSPSMPKATVYRTPTLFVQMLVDMKNALKPVPGKFVASGHDYRGDLARFVSFVYDLPVSADQLEAVEQALRSNEITLQKRIEQTTAADEI